MSEQKPLSWEIRELIMQTESPKDKAMLLILHRIADSLDTNTDMTRDLDSKFSRHEKEEMALIQQGRGFLRAIIFALAAFQGLMAYMLNEHVQSHKRLLEEVRTLSEFRAAHVAHHKEEERYRGPQIK